MVWSKRFFLGIIPLAVALPLMVWADAGADELEQNRRLLEKWRRDPEHYARLRRDLQKFLTLPPERQTRARDLNRALQEEDSAGYARLRGVLERYTDWLRRLPESDRQRIEAAPNSNQRLRIVKEIRQREWIDRLPLATRQELQRLPGEQQVARIAELRRQERERRAEWRTAFRHRDELIRQRPPQQRVTALQQLEPEIRTFITESLAPLLTREEKERLRAAHGQWPLFPQTLVELVDKHPIRLPPAPKTGPTHFDELPPAVKNRLPELKTSPPAEIAAAEGKWPEYPLAVMEYAKPYSRLRVVRQMGPCRPDEFAASVREFREKKLLPVLGESEKELLSKAEGHWPQYPRVLLQLSRKHGLQVPGMTLPGPKHLWDAFRAQPLTASAEELPEVPDYALLEFVRGLEPQERTKLPSLSLDNPAGRMLLKQAYFQRHPAELQRLRQADMKRKQQLQQMNKGKPRK
jgi:hypothetical protein